MRKTKELHFRYSQRFEAVVTKLSFELVQHNMHEMPLRAQNISQFVVLCRFESPNCGQAVLCCITRLSDDQVSCETEWK
jgi:hypothetical protein